MPGIIVTNPQRTPTGRWIMSGFLQFLLAGQVHVFQIIQALSFPAGFAGALHRWQQERHEDTDDRDDDQQFDQGESGWTLTEGGRHWTNVVACRRPSEMKTRNLPVHNWHLHAMARIKANTPADPV